MEGGDLLPKRTLRANFASDTEALVHWGGALPQRPGELCEMDATPFDVMLIQEDGTVGRYELVGVIDVTTRTLLATILVPTAKAVDAALLLYRAMTPLRMQPGWDASIEYSRSVLPHGMLADSYELDRHAAARPMVTPEAVTIDRGKIFDSQVFHDACEHLQISVLRANPYTPTDKPHIERGFKTINLRFARYLNGYVGRSVSTRGKDPTKEALWAVNEVQNLLDQWIVTHYQNEPLEGLRHPSLPARDLSPNQMYAALAGIAPPSYVRLDHNQALNLPPMEYRVISRRGVKLNKIYYTADELGDLVGRHSGLTGEANGRWEIRYDPTRLARIWVKNHIDGTWIEARWRARRTVPEFSLATLRAAVKALGDPDDPPAQNVLDEIIRMQTRGGLTAKERKAVRRDATAGTDTSNPIPNIDPAEDSDEDDMPPVQRHPLFVPDDDDDHELEILT